MGAHQRGTRSADAPGASPDDAASVRASVDVVLLTSDEKLLSTLREASSAHHELWHADSADSAIDLLVGGRSGIFIADLALFDGDGAALLERLQTQFPELIILATGRREEEATVAAAISSGCIYRFLHKPVSPARASLFLGTATRRYGELRQVEALALATVRQAARRPRFGKLGMALGGLAALALVSAAGLWWASDRAPGQNVGAAVGSPIDDYLVRAQEAFKAGRLADATNDNALAWYRTALAAAPDHEAARAGIDRVIAALDKRTVVELRRGDVIAATAALAELERAHPAHPHLASLRRQLRSLSLPVAKATVTATPARIDQVPRIAPEASPPTSAPATGVPAPLLVAMQSPAPAPAVTLERAAAPATAPEPTPEIDRARARLAATQLIAPVDDSAAAYLRRARQAGEDETKLKIIATDLASRILQQAMESLASGNLPESRSDYEAAAALDSEFELGLPDLDAVAQQVQKAQALAAASSDPAPRMPPLPLMGRAAGLREAGQLLAPAGNNAFEEFMSVAAAHENDLAVLTERTRLASALLDRARTALAAGQTKAARALAEASAKVESGKSSTTRLLQQITAAESAPQPAPAVR